MESIDIGKYRGIVVLTGAGVSAASGIRTFRGKDGLWNDATIARLSDIGTFRTEPLEVWKFWSAARAISAAAGPNAAHRALAALEKRLRPDQRLTLITQNVDGLHRRAGSANVIEYHGSVHRSRCSNGRCGLESFADSAVYETEVPACPLCGSPLRPDIVFFGEMIPPDLERAARAALDACDLFIAAGTSGTVHPANGFVRHARDAGARTVLVNLEELEDGSPQFMEIHRGKAEELLPLLLGASGQEGRPPTSPRRP
ncbi:MAG: hypothetical protein A2Z99_08545 [Treponema sp. GWB1_62_6]|nr:MAG: hypothetical protein A2001_08475 [Treponema sp. GWC1_61_84]OHE66810.1 MAG: hypothetical protein A2Y36_08755 [Treponema sp. GWA1_62_8]OHE69896.1 MAG: hypothetical protein A2Z99_08545 [Treponema sp. GWB1_62_6]OHE71471.1 MAG: hypothetical protein A2413_18900 [Treponema sp. RIFOXYC1_FULL_61_9]HCM25572.1 Sir2 family transcriptional regulator [Treponema sp.]